MVMYADDDSYWRIFVYIFCSSLSDEANKRKPLNIERAFSYLSKFEPDIPNGSGEILFQKLKILQRMYGSLTFLPPSIFTVLDGRYFLQLHKYKLISSFNF